MDAWQHWIKRFFSSEGQSDTAESGTKKKTNSVLLLVVLGVLLLLWARMDFTGPEQQSIQNAGLGLPTAPRTEEGYEAELEQRVERLLRSMRGVGDVEVMITLDTTGTRVFAMERTEERSLSQPTEGAPLQTTEERLTERPVVIREDQGRTESPLVVTSYQPIVRGVVVLAEGAYDPGLRYEIARVVQTALGVPAHRVQVFTKE